MEDRQMVYSAMKTPDGTILESLHRHDYNAYIDKNGSHYMIDGGLDYVRWSSPGDHEWLTVYAEEPFEKVRKFWHWGRNYDANMNLLPKREWVKLCEMTNDHLLAVYEYPGVPAWCNELFSKEIEYRKL